MRRSPLSDEVQSYIRTELGDEAAQVAVLLSTLGSATDTVLADQLKTRTSYIRRALYALYGARVAGYHEHRDDTKGWLTFVWSLDPDQARKAIREAKATMEGRVRDEIARLREGSHYACPEHPDWLAMAEAVATSFQCPSCGKVLQEAPVEGRIQELSKTLAALRPGAS